MKCLIVGAGDWHIYEEAFYQTGVELGFEMQKFYWRSYLESKNNFILRYTTRAQNKYLIGKRIKKLNKELINFCNENKPDLVFIYRGTHIFPETLEQIKKNDCLVFGYNNDDPFSDRYKKYVWRHYRNCIPLYDFIFSYREKNIKDYAKLKYYNTEVLKSYYLINNNFPISPKNYTHDVVFIGHFENDGRDECIKYLIENNIDIKIYGDSSWKNSTHYNYIVEQCGEIYRLGTEYNEVLNSTKIALVFLSKINYDTYTRRCFEIPATKTFMLSEETEDLKGMYAPGIDADYFKSKKELLSKITYYLENDIVRENIALNGYNRLKRDGHEVKDRFIQISNKYSELR